MFDVSLSYQQTKGGNKEQSLSLVRFKAALFMYKNTVHLVLQ